MTERSSDCREAPRRRRRAGRIGAGRWRRLLALCALAAGPCVAEAAEYLVGPRPAWVSLAAEPTPDSTPGTAIPGGTRLQLMDQQTLISATEQARFVHTIVEALTGDGVGPAAAVAMSFDPTYETLTLHDVRVRRAGVALPRLKDATVKVMRRERGLESRIYDGRKTVSLILKDVRPGDAVEASYTVVGHNPVFGAHRFRSFDMQWGIPAAHVRYRLLVRGLPALRTLGWNGAPPPSTATVGDLREIVWEDREVAALRLEVDAPLAHQPFRRIGWSDFRDWGEVARWAETLFPAQVQPGPMLQAERDRIERAFATPQDRTLAVLRLVQEQVRYVGVEIGANSHAPSAPAVVFERRFGDCKEKALLVATLLRSLGVDARVALVDSIRQEAIEADLPSPGSFDHAVTRVQIGTAVYWLDPTRAPQRGDLDHVAQAHYGKALVLDGQSTSLVAMPAERAADRQRDVRIDIDLTRGTAGNHPVQVTTIYRGDAAEDLRSSLADAGRDEMQRRATNFYERSYPGIRVAAPLEVSDDERGNAVTVVEHYVASITWKEAPGPGLRIARFETPELHEPLQRPPETVRRMPLDLGPPEVLNLALAVHLPHLDRPLKVFDRVVDPLFTLSRQAGNVGDTLRVSYHFERLAATATPGDLPRYTMHLAQARDLLDYDLRARPQAPTSIVVRAGIAEVVLAAGLLLLRWRSARQRAVRGRAIAAQNRELEIRALHGDIVTLLPMPDADRGVHWGIYLGVAALAALFMFAAILGMFGVAEDPRSNNSEWWLVAAFGLPGLWMIRLLVRNDPK